MAIDHFSSNYGETINVKAGVEFAPKYDFNIQDRENKELRKIYEPLQKELKKEKQYNKTVLVKYNKLMGNVEYTRSVREICFNCHYS